MTKRALSVAIAFLLVVPLLQAASPAAYRAEHGVVASVTGLSSQIGAEIMQKGGNAVDAAVAVGLALAVTWPSAGNLGGGGFMLIRKADGATEMIDYRERAPLAASRDMYLDDEGRYIKDSSVLGHRAVAVPGTIAGFALAIERHGNLSWAEVVEPSIRIAEKGLIVDYYLAKSLADEDNYEKLSAFPESRRIFTRGEGPWKEGERFVQKDLAATLKRVKENGPREFYEGETARLIIQEIERGGGVITMEDLRTYKPSIREPLRGEYRGYEVLTAPPPSSGGVMLIQMLGMLEGFDVSSLAPGSAAKIHLMTEVERRAFADRAAYMGDTDFVDVPIEQLLSPEYIDARRRTIDLTKASRSSDVGAGDPYAYESAATTHYSIIDAQGNVVSNTYTLNGSYGSGVTVTGAGFLLNNEMDDFTAKPGVPNQYGAMQSENNAIAPKKRPLSSMTPAIVLKDGKVFFAVGSPGGPTIINTVLQVIVNVIDHGMAPQEAVDAPRFHHQWLPDEIEWEPGGLNADTRAILEKMGHRFEADPKLHVQTFHGDAECVMVEPGTGMRLGASDPRKGGKSAGY